MWNSACRERLLLFLLLIEMKLRYIICIINFLISREMYCGVIKTSDRNNIVKKEKLSLLNDWHEYNLREPDGPGTYAFGFDIEDSKTADGQFRSEEKLANGTVTGSYGYVTPEGNIHIVHYVADHLGYRTKIEDSGKSFTNVALPTINNNMSSEMIAALTSLGNNRLEQNIQEEHKRPMNNKDENQFLNNEKNYSYNVYHVPDIEIFF